MSWWCGFVRFGYCEGEEVDRVYIMALVTL
jgi:hypothetical protein